VYLVTLLKWVQGDLKLTITISPELESRLRQQAEREGKAVDDMAESLLARALEWARQDREEAIAGIQRGLDDSAAGRVRPAVEVFTEMRSRIERAKS
jgi:predicted transcriptional regulator